MAISLTEIFLTIILPIVVVVLLIRWFRMKKRIVTESVVLSLIRSRNGATIDDIILGAHISADEAGATLRRLLSKGVIRVEERDEKTIYKIA
jgi:predicted transcriptional regulator